MIANHMSLIFAVLTGGEGPRKSSRRLRIIACVGWRFWLGALDNKGGRGQRKRE